MSDMPPRRLGVLKGSAAADRQAARHTPFRIAQEYQWLALAGPPKFTTPTPHPPPNDPPSYTAI